MSRRKLLIPNRVPSLAVVLGAEVERVHPVSLDPSPWRIRAQGPKLKRQLGAAARPIALDGELTDQCRQSRGALAARQLLNNPGSVTVAGGVPSRSGMLFADEEHT